MSAIVVNLEFAQGLDLEDLRNVLNKIPDRLATITVRTKKHKVYLSIESEDNWLNDSGSFGFSNDHLDFLSPAVDFDEPEV